jgi:transcription elongation factor
VRIYAGASGDFTIYQDDGKTYAYEKGKGTVTHLHWNNISHKLSHDGPAAWSGPDPQVLEIIGH